MKATKSQARACYDNYFGTLRCYNGGTREENERSADGCREAVRPYVEEAERLAATAGKLLRADAWLMRALTEDIPANFAAFSRHYPESAPNGTGKPILGALLDASESFAQPAPGRPQTCSYCGYVSDTGEHCTTPGCPGNVAAIEEPAPGGTLPDGITAAMMGKLAYFTPEERAVIVRSVNHAEALAEALNGMLTCPDYRNINTHEARKGWATLAAWEDGK